MNYCGKTKMWFRMEICEIKWCKRWQNDSFM